MNLDRRWLLLRAAVWIAIVAYAVAVIRDPGLSDAVGQAALEASGLAPRPGWVEIPPPAGGRPPAAPGHTADALALAGTLATPECHYDGLRLVLGPGGLERAYTRGPAPTCLAERLWALPWPGVEAVELEV